MRYLSINRIGKTSYFAFNLRRLIIAGLAFSCSMVSATSAVLVTDAKLKIAPSFKSAELATMSKGEMVEIQKRQRGWYQVKRNDSKMGWITLLQVRFQSEKQTNSASTVSRLVSLRKGHSSVTATTGVRGIGEADIKNAKANFAALELAKQFKSSKDSAKKFAQKVPLKTQKIKYMEKSNEN